MRLTEWEGAVAEYINVESDISLPKSQEKHHERSHYVYCFTFCLRHFRFQCIFNA